jgi:hypothetical protein
MGESRLHFFRFPVLRAVQLSAKVVKVLRLFGPQSCPPEINGRST